jgi:hypothetical protein
MLSRAFLAGHDVAKLLAQSDCQDEAGMTGSAWESC